MASTTHTEFGASTEALAVAAAFPDSIKGRTVIITGVNKLGMGYATAEAFASQSPKHLILAGRTQTKVQECVDVLRARYPDVEYRIVLLDLSSQESARAAAAQVLDWADIPTIDLVILNAGVMNIPERKVSNEGIEMHMATNHVGHFLFTNLIMPKIVAAAKCAPKGSTRIVSVSSLAIGVSPLRKSDVNWEKPSSQIPEAERPNFMAMKFADLDVNEEMSYIPMAAYGQSKTANLLYTVSLNEKLFESYGILSLALHPGEVMSELQRTTDSEWHQAAHKKMKLVPKTLQEGASTTMVAALDPKLTGEGTQFLSDCQISKAVPPYALEKTEASALWEMSESWVGQTFSW